MRRPFALLACLEALVLLGCEPAPALLRDGPPLQLQAPVQSQPPVQLLVRDTLPLSRWVLRVACKKNNSAGTAFVHSSGRVLTAAHVVEGCSPADVSLFVKDSPLPVVEVVADRWLDIALLTPRDALGTGLTVGSGDGISVGDTVVTWGFPMGYFGLEPMVSVGYLAARAPVPASPKPVLRAFVNGAFNLGNSGGPVIDVRTLTVVGIVNAKMAPVPPDVASAMAAMQQQSSGFVYTAKTPDGRTVSLSEAQVVSRVLEHLQSQTQLVVGTAVILGDIREFLKKHGIEP